jgi:hypothetical protein
VKTYAVTMVLSVLAASFSMAAGPISSEDEAFEKRFEEVSKLGVTLEHHPALDGPWGSPNPDAAREIQQFAFMIGRHECTQYFKGMNPGNPDQELEGDLLWLAYYALDGRAIRDEFYSMGGNGEQTRAYDSFAMEWWVTYATVPGVVNLTPEPKPKRGSFTAVQNEKGHMVMTTPAKDANDNDIIRTITFYDINNGGFEWKSENVYADKSINTGSISCRKVAGPGHK